MNTLLSLGVVEILFIILFILIIYWIVKSVIKIIPSKRK